MPIIDKISIFLEANILFPSKYITNFMFLHTKAIINKIISKLKEAIDNMQGRNETIFILLKLD